MTTDSTLPSETVLNQMRFGPEQQRLQSLMEAFELEPILSHFESEGGVKSFRDGILSNNLKLTRTMAPRLFAALDSVCRALGYRDPVDLFVAEDSNFNAFAVYSLDNTPHIIVLTSRLIERMTNEEIRFVLGHELGHLQFKHYRMRMVPRAFGKDSDGDSKVPTLLSRRLEIWHRLAELSADRAGFVAAEGRLDSVVSVFFKIASGLGPEHLQFDISAFLQQLEELKQLQRRDTLCDFSHPSIPIRVRALQLYRDAGGPSATGELLAQVDAEVSELTQLMERKPSDPEELHKLNYVLAGGVLIGHADGRGLGDREMQILIEMLMPLTSDPEETIASITTSAQAENMLAESAAWMRENTGELKFHGFRYLCIIAAAEGMTPGEEQLLYHIAEMTGIPRKAAGDLIHEVMTNFAGKGRGGSSTVHELK
jgi:Zn-dependent protease with chaperone function